ncbi:MAG: formate hydrogenlyase [Acidobacteriota bacterium]|nr:formate hydrogenlyase [Acidobacteriota bacterium]
MHTSILIAQVLKVLAAGLLLISFAMLSARRTQQLITLFAWQGAMLFVSTCLVAYSSGLTEMYYSAALTLLLKVITLPWILNRLIRRLRAQWDTEQLVKVPTTMLAGLVLVIFAFGLAQPISLMATTITGHTLGIALAVILLAFLMMITRRKAVTQVIGFLAMENGLFLAATSATYGMPMVIELGIALDLLVGVFILGIFFFQIREQFDSLDLRHLESLKED